MQERWRKKERKPNARGFIFSERRKVVGEILCQQLRQDPPFSRIRWGHRPMKLIFPLRSLALRIWCVANRASCRGRHARDSGGRRWPSSGWQILRSSSWFGGRLTRRRGRAHVSLVEGASPADGIGHPTRTELRLIGADAADGGAMGYIS